MEVDKNTITDMDDTELFVCIRNYLCDQKTDYDNRFIITCLDELQIRTIQAEQKNQELNVNWSIALTTRLKAEKRCQVLAEELRKVQETIAYMEQEIIKDCDALDEVMK